MFFFFSSRRRHTRWPRDWSSDVCSSDLDTVDLCEVRDHTIGQYDDTSRAPFGGSSEGGCEPTLRRIWRPLFELCGSSDLQIRAEEVDLPVTRDATRLRDCSDPPSLGRTGPVGYRHTERAVEEALYPLAPYCELRHRELGVE